MSFDDDPDSDSSTADHSCGFDELDRMETLVYDDGDDTYDEDITSTGFIPPENFHIPTADDSDEQDYRSAISIGTREIPLPSWLRYSRADRTLKIGSMSFDLPTVTWLDKADPVERLQYAGIGLIAGLFLGGLVGIFYTLIQGAAVADGSREIFLLAFVWGLVCTPLAALRPRRVDELLERIGISDD